MDAIKWAEFSLRPDAKEAELLAFAPGLAPIASGKARASSTWIKTSGGQRPGAPSVAVNRGGMAVGCSILRAATLIDLASPVSLVKRAAVRLPNAQGRFEQAA